MARLPCARRTGLVIEELPDEVLVYDSERDHAMCLNRTAASVWKHCDGNTTPARIARLIEKEFRITGGDEVVTLALDHLEKAHLLTRETSARLSGISRREVVRRLGVSAAVLPVISMIQVQPAGTITSCIPLGNGCKFDGDCCSGCCSDFTCVPTSNCFKK